MTKEQVSYLQMIGFTLPNLGGMPVTHDHCFARILLDTHFGGRWQKFLPSPAYKNLSAAELKSLTCIGDSIVEGKTDIWQLNKISRGYRCA